MAAIVVVLGALHAVWLHRERRGGPLDIDEAAYLTLAFSTSSASHRILTGPLLLWRDSGYLAPLVPLVTAPFQYVFGRSVEVGHLSNLVFFAALAVGAFLLARRLLPPWWSVLAALVVATLPAVTDYTRHYHFAVASAATFTAALVALLRSERFAHRGWAMGFGACLGLVVLSRTFMLAYVPALLAAAVLLVWQSGPTRRRAAGINLLLALAIGGAIAASWYFFSAREVLDYLTGYGYGDESTSYGPASVDSLRFWLSDLVSLVSDGFYVPIALLLGVGTVVGLVTLVCTTPARDLARRVARSDALPLLVAFGTGFAALLSSRNTGTGFVLPLLAPTTVLALATTTKARPRAVAGTFAVLVACLCLFNVAMKSQVTSAFDHEVALTAAPWARLRVSDGRSIIDRYVEDHTDRTNDGRDDGWLAAGAELHDLTETNEPPDDSDPEVLFTVEGPLFTSSIVSLASQVSSAGVFGARSLDLAEIPALTDPDALTARLRELRAAGIDQVVTGPGGLSWDNTALPEEVTTQSARAAGFRPVGRVALPDGREVTLWAAETGAP